METFSQIIDALGGPTAYASLVNTSPQNAWQMRDRNSVRPAFWPATVKAAAVMGIDGITFESLAKIAAARKPAASPSQPHEVA